MDIKIIKPFTAVLLAAFSMNAAAVSIEIAQSSLFLSLSPEPLIPSLQDDQQGIYQSVADPFAPARSNTFGSSGFNVSYSDNLVDNLGGMTWNITNNTGADIASSHIMGFLDADLGADDFWNEYGALFGNADSQYDAWEIDEPGYLFGDIYDHLQDTGDLDETNSIPASSPEDVSLALGFDISNWLAGETIIATFLIADAANSLAGLAQFNMGTTDAIYFSGSVQNIGVVPIPGTGGFMLFGLITLAFARYRQKKI